VLLFYYLNLCNYVLVWYDVWIGFVKHETWLGWIGGVITLWLNGYGFKPWRTKLKTLFLAFWLWIEYERLGKTLDSWEAALGSWKTDHKGQLNGS